MKRLLFLCIYVMALTYIRAGADVYTYNVTRTVYICTGPYAQRYHGKKSCRGLKNCSGSIKKVTLDEARQLGKTPCRIKGCL